MMNHSKDRGPKRERRWQTSQDRARVAAELIEEAESLTRTGAIASPNDVERDQQPPPIRVAQAVATPGPDDITMKLDEAETPEPAASPAPPPPPSTTAPEPQAPAPEDPLYVSAREATDRGEIDRPAASYRNLLGPPPSPLSRLLHSRPV